MHHIPHPTSHISHPTAPRCFTIDVEDLYHTQAARPLCPPHTWDQQPARLEQTLDQLLELLDQYQTKATLFVLGHAAKRHPQLAPRAAALGHEIASHGHNHTTLNQLTPHQFKQDLLTAKHRLEDQTGQPVLGYRAPSFSLTPHTAHWAAPLIAQTGHTYDSSIFPTTLRKTHAFPHAPTTPFPLLQYLKQTLSTSNIEHRTSDIQELPPLTYQLHTPLKHFQKQKPAEAKGFCAALPAAGGAYLRFFPTAYTAAALKQAALHHRPAILYTHPWELDHTAPRFPLPFKQRIRTYHNQHKLLHRFHRLLSRFPATPTSPWLTCAQLAQPLTTGHPASAGRGLTKSAA
ncbi:MAG: polysaccharide deacetylase family protein [Planctomycetota bacterium]